MRMVPVGSQATEAKGELSGNVSHKPSASGRKTTTERCVGRALDQGNNGLLIGSCFKVCCFSGPDDRLPHGLA